MKRNPDWRTFSSLAIWEGVRSKDRETRARMSCCPGESDFAGLKGFDDPVQRLDHPIALGMLVAAKPQSEAELTLGSDEPEEALRRLRSGSLGASFLTVQ